MASRLALLWDAPPVDALQKRRERRRLAALFAALAYIVFRGENRLEAHWVPPRLHSFDVHTFHSRDCIERFRCQLNQSLKVRLLMKSGRWCGHTGRFEAEDVEVLAAALLPPVVRTSNRLAVAAVEALCMLLWRLAYPNRLRDGIALFNRSIDQISRISNAVASTIYDRVHVKLEVCLGCLVSQLLTLRLITPSFARIGIRSC